MYDYRFFLTINAKQNFGAIHLGDLNNTKELDDINLRKYGISLIENNSNYINKASTTHMIVVDYGISKLSNGLGASYPIETIILTKP
jgi:hypothetical protein